MEKFMKVYWAVVKFFAIFVALEVLCIIALSTICNLIDGTNRTQYEHPAQPFKYNYRPQFGIRLLPNRKLL